MNNTERPEGSLARVTYLFGEPGSEPSEGRSPARPEESVGEWVVPGLSREARGGPAPVVPDRAERRAHNVGLNALARRGMSVHEMRALLVRRELEPEAIEVEIERLCAGGLLDDDALAENLVRTLSERKRLGRSAIAAELNRRRIDAASIEVALSALGDDELEQAIEIAVARARQLQSYDRETAQRRLSGYLARRGYSGTTASAAVRVALDSGPLGRSLTTAGPRFE